MTDLSSACTSNRMTEASDDRMIDECMRSYHLTLDIELFQGPKRLPLGLGLPGNGVQLLQDAGQPLFACCRTTGNQQGAMSEIIYRQQQRTHTKYVPCLHNRRTGTLSTMP